MSERLLFELKAIDNATAPIRRVSDQLARTGAEVRRMGGSMDVSTRSTRKFAMGALQQAGYQIGDFAVQVANGTSKIQAFGQQAPQMLQIFGPIGAIVGAGVAIVAAFGVAMQKSGKELGNFGSALGVLREPLSAVTSSVMSLGKVFGSVFPTIVQNIDTAIIAVGLFAAVMAIKAVPALVASVGASALFSAAMVTFRAAVLASALGAGRLSMALILARAAVMTLGASIKAVGLLLMRFLPIALLLGLAKLIELFMRLVKGAGGFGNALKLLWDVAKAVFAGMAGYANGFGLILKAVSLLFTSNFVSAFASIMKKWEDLINSMISGWNTFTTSVGMESLVAEKYVSGWAKSAGESVETLRKQSGEAAGAASENFKKANAGISSSWQALKAAVAAGTEEVTLFGDASAAATDKAGAGVEKLTQQQETMKAIAEGIRSSFSEAFMSMVDGTKTVLGAFKDMVRQIILKLYEQLVVQQMVNAAMGFVGKAFPALAPFVSGAKAMGGPVTGGKPYMVGERGPEIVVPSRNGNVIANNQLGGGGVTVVQNINITTGVQQTVRAEIRSLMPQIADSAKRAVLDAKQRGGSYGSAFA
jgi:hypothetical protein